MANRKVTMTHLRAIIREFKLGTPMREIERKLKISRTSLRPYRERAESSGKSMDELLKMEDADLHAILSKEDVHRNRDTNRYEFLQANIEDYAQAMTRKYMTLLQSDGQSVWLHAVQIHTSGVREEERPETSQCLCSCP